MVTSFMPKTKKIKSKIECSSGSRRASPLLLDGSVVPSPSVVLLHFTRSVPIGRRCDEKYTLYKTFLLVA
jgi:hypothetical protein